MTMNNKKMTLLATAALVALPLTAAHALLTANLDAAASFNSTLSIVNTTNMDFANWDYGHSPIAGDTIDLGTDSSVTPSANFIQNGGVLAAGVATVTGVSTFPIEVRCDTSAKLAEAGGVTIDVVNIKVTDGAGAAYPAGDVCAIAVPVIYNLVAGSAVLKFGGRIDGATASGAFPAGAVVFNTSIGVGDDIQVDVVYQ